MPELMTALAEQVIAGDYYCVNDDERPGRVSIDWPWSLASTALSSLPDCDEAGLRHLEALCARVEREDWVTRWDDPGDYPSGAGAGPLPTRWEAAPEVHALARAVREIVDDLRGKEASDG